MDSGELNTANNEIAILNQEKQNQATELTVAYKEIAFQIEERGKRAAELAIANLELIFQNEEKEKRAAELIIANKELVFQNEEKEKRAAELIIANREHNKAKAELLKLNAELEQTVIKRTAQYAFISHVNQTIVHVKDPYTLFRNLCRIALEYGRFEMVWIGSFDLARKNCTLLDYGGIAADGIKMFTDVPLADSPQGYVLRTGKFFVCNDIDKAPEFEEFNIYAKKYKVRSYIVLPIKKSGSIFGTFNLYSTEPNFFDDVNISVAVEVTDDISFALDLFEKTERHKKAEELIVTNEKRFRLLIENSADVLTLTSREGKLTYFSPSLTKVLGYTMDDPLNVPALDFIHPNNIANYTEKRRELLELPGKSYHDQIRLKHKDGRWIWCETTITNMLDEPGIEATVANFRDTSDKKLREIQQEFDRNNLNALINNTNDLMWSVDRDFKLITSNIPFDKLTKASLGKSIAKGENVLLSAGTPEMLAHFKQLYERAFEGNSFTEIDHFDSPVDLWMQISYYPIRKGEEIIGTACHSRDITEIINNKQQLKYLADRLVLATDSAKIGIWDWDTQTNTLVWDDIMYSIFGIDRDEFCGASEAYTSALHPDDLQNALDDVQAALDGDKGFESVFRIKWKNDEIRFIEGHATILRDIDGKANRMIGVNRDITEQKVAEEIKSKLINDLIQRNRDLEQFTFIISHNLRAPTANIIGFTEILQDDTLTPQEQKEFLHGLSSSVSGLDAVIKDINSILQIKSEINDKKERISFSAIVSDIIIGNSNFFDKYQARIETNFSEVDEIFSLMIFLQSIFFNLISNSIKYSMPDVQPLIEITSRKEVGKTIITFKDNGLGIDMEKYGPTVFGLYRRFHSHVEGKGMGLFLVKTQVEALGGTITLESQVNKGSEFTIVFNNK
jgi:PAS domain S-box-containing protein